MAEASSTGNPVTAAQQTQQNNRDTAGRYATQVRGEDDTFQVPATQTPVPWTRLRGLADEAASAAHAQSRALSASAKGMEAVRHRLLELGIAADFADVEAQFPEVKDARYLVGEGVTDDDGWSWWRGAGFVNASHEPIDTAARWQDQWPAGDCGDESQEGWGRFLHEPGVNFVDLDRVRAFQQEALQGAGGGVAGGSQGLSRKPSDG